MQPYMHERRPVINRPHENDRKNPLLKGKTFMTAEIRGHAKVEASTYNVEPNELKRRERVENPSHDRDVLAF